MFQQLRQNLQTSMRGHFVAQQFLLYNANEHFCCEVKEKNTKNIETWQKKAFEN